MGYKHIAIPKGWSFRTATFKDMNDGNKLDLTDIKPMRVNKGAIVDFDQSVAGKCVGNIYLCFIDATTGMYSDVYKYYSTLDENRNIIGWVCDKAGVQTPIAKGSVFIHNGQGVIVNSTKNDGTAVFRFAGEVDLVNQTAIPKGWSFAGNNTPVAFDLLDMKPMRINKGSIVDFDQSVAGKCVGNIYICKISASSGMYGSPYQYYSTLDDNNTVKGWMVEIDGVLTKVTRNMVIFEPGDGFIIRSTKNDGTAIMQLPCPIAKNDSEHEE